MKKIILFALPLLLAAFTAFSEGPHSGPYYVPGGGANTGSTTLGGVLAAQTTNAVFSSAGTNAILGMVGSTNAVAATLSGALNGAYLGDQGEYQVTNWSGFLTNGAITVNLNSGTITPTSAGVYLLSADVTLRPPAQWNAQMAGLEIRTNGVMYGTAASVYQAYNSIGDVHLAIAPIAVKLPAGCAVSMWVYGLVTGWTYILPEANLTVASLAAAGPQGATGANGTNGINGINGTNGINGATGPAGSGTTYGFSSNFSVNGTNVDVTNSPHATSADAASAATNVANYVVWKRMGTVAVSGAEANVVFETNSTMLTTPAYALDGPPHVFKLWVDRAGLVEYYESYDGITFTNYSLNPVATNGYCNSLFSKGGTNYMFATDYGQNYENLYMLSNNVHFVLLQTNVLFTGSGNLGNIAVSTNANGYFMLYDDIEVGGSWYIYEAFSTTLTNWVVPTAASRTAVPVIAQPGGLMGAAWINVVNGVYYCWCHGSETNGLNLRWNGSSVNPTCLYRWHSLDSSNWVCDGQTLLRDTYDEGATDLSGQLADPCLIEVTNQCYLYYSAGGSQTPPQSPISHVKVAKANMSLATLVKTSETGDHSEIAQNNMNFRRINTDVSVGNRLPLNWNSGINSGLAVVNQLYIPVDQSPANFPPQLGGYPGLFIFATNDTPSIYMGYGGNQLWNNIIVGGDIEYRIVSSNLQAVANYLTVAGNSSSISSVVLGNTGAAITLLGTIYGNGHGLTNLPFAKTFTSTNGSFSYTVNSDGSTNVTFVLTNSPSAATYTILSSNLANTVLYTNTSSQRVLIEGRYQTTLGSPGIGGYYFISVSGGRDGNNVTNTYLIKGASGNVLTMDVSRHINAGEVFEFMDDTASGSGTLTNCDIIY